MTPPSRGAATESSPGRKPWEIGGEGHLLAPFPSPGRGDRTGAPGRLRTPPGLGNRDRRNPRACALGYGLSPLRGCRAFTFIELMLATGMMAILVVAMYSALRVAFKARDTALNAIGPARSAEVAMELVRRDLESALPPTGDIAGEFIGTAGAEVSGTSAVRFYALGGPARGTADDIDATGTAGRTASEYQWKDGDPTVAGGVRRIELLVRPSANNFGDPDAGSVLVRRTTRHLLAEVEPEYEEETLCRNVIAFTIQYFDGSQWLDYWDSTVQDNAMPVAVEVRLRVAEPKTDRSDAYTPLGAADTGYVSSRVFFLACRREPALQATGGGA